MKVLFITDSLLLPRKIKNESVVYEETYFYLLKNYFKTIDFVNCSIGGASINELLNQSSYYQNSLFDIIFIQCGIVDCAPRAFKDFEKKIISKLKILSIAKKFEHYLRAKRNYSKTNFINFEKYLIELVKSFEQSKNIYSLGILPAQPTYEFILPTITKKIKTYNNILKKHTLYIDNDNFPYNGIFSDYHHLNAEGHQIIFEKIKTILKQHNHESI